MKQSINEWKLKLIVSFLDFDNSCVSLEDDNNSHQKSVDATTTEIFNGITELLRQPVFKIQFICVIGSNKLNRRKKWFHLNEIRKEIEMNTTVKKMYF